MRVSSLDVEYIGWNAYGVCVHVASAGRKFVCANPFATLAGLGPLWWVERSLTVVTSPSGESWIDTRSESPPFMNRSFDASGVNDARVAVSGPGGAWGTPSCVRNAKFGGSGPTRLRQSA